MGPIIIIYILYLYYCVILPIVSIITCIQTTTTYSERNFYSYIKSVGIKL